MATNTTIMASKQLRASLFPAIRQQRAFSVSSRALLNPLLNLSHFSASKEAQYLSKERKIPRTEFSPHLELIRSSEVDIFAPAPGASPIVIAELKRAEMGQTDLQTAYSLAIFNLGQQVQSARQEATRASETLAKIQDKHSRDERKSFILMLASILLLSTIFVKTNAFEELKQYVDGFRKEGQNFDWEWLGNPPSHKRMPNRQTSLLETKPEPPTFVLSTPNGSPLLPIEEVSDQGIRREKATQTELTPSAQRWTPSRLFWAAP